MFLLAVTAVAPMLLANPVKAVSIWDDPYSQEGIGFLSFNDIGMGKRDPRAIAAAVVNVLLGFLGVIAVILILVGGFRWMIANGNQANIDTAKKTMIAGVVGLAIVLAAFAVSIFVTRVLLGATGGNSNQTYQNE